jgi:hypothetical protein
MAAEINLQKENEELRLKIQELELQVRCDRHEIIRSSCAELNVIRWQRQSSLQYHKMQTKARKGLGPA